MSLFPSKSGYGSKIELRSKECIDAVLQPLKDHVIIKINGSLTCENIFRNGCEYGSQHPFCPLSL